MGRPNLSRENKFSVVDGDRVKKNIFRVQLTTSRIGNPVDPFSAENTDHAYIIPYTTYILYIYNMYILRTVDPIPLPLGNSIYNSVRVVALAADIPN